MTPEERVRAITFHPGIIEIPPGDLLTMLTAAIAAEREACAALVEKWEHLDACAARRCDHDTIEGCHAAAIRARNPGEIVSETE